MVQVVIEHCFGEFRARMHRDFRYTTEVTGSGCPLGRGITAVLAVYDLARRAQLDGGSLTVADMEIVEETLECS